MKKHCIWSLMTLVLLLGVLVFLCACDGSGSGSRMAERREEQADHGRDPVPGIPDDMEFDTNPDPMINDEDEPTGQVFAIQLNNQKLTSSLPGRSPKKQVPSFRNKKKRPSLLL